MVGVTKFRTKKDRKRLGTVAIYYSRARALKKLQLSLRDFRKLCILKGIYPRCPKYRKKALRGKADWHSLYHRKDIMFLMNEPIIAKMREMKAHAKRLNKAYKRKEMAYFYQLRDRKPTYKIDHIIRERYPSFLHAVRDLEDCLCLLCVFATFPKSRKSHENLVALCQRLTTEFMLYVIEQRALRKVFVSVKGFYFEADIMGQKILWLAPHKFTYQMCFDVDIKIMQTFAEFYTTLLGFINYRLYHSLNLMYPPRLEEQPILIKAMTEENKTDAYNDLLSSLNIPLVRTGVTDEEPEVDEFPELEEDAFVMKLAKAEQFRCKRVINLFTGLRFFLNREVPREYLVFMIRACGGQVSWDYTIHNGSTFPENDENITHHIGDREEQEKKYMSRYYVQPQWVFDSINVGKLLPVQDYFMGATLPPHLSPFAYEGPGGYVPPERKAQKDLIQGKKTVEKPAMLSKDEEDDDDKFFTGQDLEELGEGLELMKDYATGESVGASKDSHVQVADDDDDEDDGMSDDSDMEKTTVVATSTNIRKKNKKKNKQRDTPITNPKKLKTIQHKKQVAAMKVSQGEVDEPDTARIEKREEEILSRLNMGLLSKKKRRIYQRMKKSRTTRNLATEKLAMKRAEIEGQIPEGTTDKAFKKGKVRSAMFRQRIREVTVRTKPLDYSELPRKYKKQTKVN